MKQKKRHLTLRQRRLIGLGFILIALVAVAIALYHQPAETVDRPPNSSAPSSVSTGDVISAGVVTPYDKAATAMLVKRNYGTSVVPNYAVSKQVIHYKSVDPAGHELNLVAQVFLPQSLPAGQTVPALAFAPGTTGMGDECAASLEQPTKVNWANYDSHLAAYASQGYAVVMTDYEGMDDPTRLHHYMVGELEGRAMLDSAKALINLPSARSVVNAKQIFLAGYSQGGHTAFWADQIAPEYAPGLAIRGVMGFGPVMDVAETWRDVTRGANINWFGPFVLASYADYYHQQFPLDDLLASKWQASLTANVISHCIDSLPSYFGHSPQTVYNANFLTKLAGDDVAAVSADLARDLVANQAGNAITATAKLINAGSLDNVVLPKQQTLAISRICQSSRGAAHLQVYPHATHYNTMMVSFHDTINWMRRLAAGQTVADDCKMDSK